MPPGTKNNLKMREAKRVALDCFALGMTVAQTMERVGRAPATYLSWIRDDPSFLRNAREARERAKSPDLKQYDFIDFRKRFFGMETYPHQRRIVEAIEDAQEGAIIMILLPPEAGKGLALTTPIPTPEGWTTMGEIKVGDSVYSADGSITSVSAVSEIHNLPCYRLTFRGGESLVCDDEHLWEARSTKSWQRQRTLWDTRSLYQSYQGGAFKVRVPVPAPLEGEEMWLPIDPYLLGVWLGDGASDAAAFASADDEIIKAFSEQYGVRHVGGYCYSVRDGLRGQLRDLGVLGNKHIPPGYLRATIADRFALLQGLMDSDGYIDPKRGRCEYTTISAKLRDDFMELCRSLGLKPRIYEARATIDGKYVGQKYRAELYPHSQIFRLSRKADALAKWLDEWGDKRDTHKWETILSIEEVESVPTKCIAVEHESKLYVVGRNMVATHNTTVIEDWICFQLAQKPNTRIGIISENKELAQKRISRIATRMTSPERFADYIATWGPFRVPGHDMSKPWNSERLTVEKSDHDERDPSIEAKGAGTALYGIRWNYVILDDIQSLKSLNRTDALVEFFRQEIATRVGQSGKYVFVGTRVGPGDVYEELLRLELVTDLVSIPALDEFGKSYWPAAHDADGRRLRMPSGDPIGWTETELAKRRRLVGEESWARVYMQQASSRAGATFTDAVLERSKDFSRSISDGVPSPGVILGLDPALTNFAGYIVGSYTATHLTIVDGESAERLMNYDAIFDLTEFYAKKWSVGEIVIESNNIQRGIARDSRIMEMKDRLGFSIVEHATGVNKFDPKIGVASMALAFTRGEITIAYGDQDTVAKMEQLFDELRKWRFDVPAKQLRQDMVMALWFVYLRWLKKRDLLGYTQQGWKRPGLGAYTTLDDIRSIGRSRIG